MPSALSQGMLAPQPLPRTARWSAGALALALATVVVLWLHALALQGLSQALPGLGPRADVVTRAFITRSVQFDNGADKAPRASAVPVAAAPPQPTPPIARKPAGGATVAASLGPTPEPLPAPTAVQPERMDMEAAPAPAPQEGVAVADAAPGPAPAPAPSPVTAASAPDVPLEATSATSPALTPALTPAVPSAVTPASDASPSAPLRPGARPAALAAAGRTDAPTMPVYDYRFPGSTRLKYEVSGLVKGFGYQVSGELLWLQDGKTYDARLEISHFLLGSRLQTSKGALTPLGLEPLRFGDKVRSEVAAHFQRAKGIVSFSANTPDAPLMPLAQDQLSVFVQLAAMWGANAGRFVPGLQLPFQAVGPRTSENWVFQVGAAERLKIGGRDLPAVKLLRERSGDYDTRVELWLAPALDYLPARIRITQSNGDEVDMLWSRTEKP